MSASLLFPTKAAAERERGMKEGEIKESRSEACLKRREREREG